MLTSAVSTQEQRLNIDPMYGLSFKGNHRIADTTTVKLATSGKIANVLQKHRKGNMILSMLLGKT